MSGKYITKVYSNNFLTGTNHKLDIQQRKLTSNTQTEIKLNHC